MRVWAACLTVSLGVLAGSGYALIRWQQTEIWALRQRLLAVEAQLQQHAMEHTASDNDVEVRVYDLEQRK